MFKEAKEDGYPIPSQSVSDKLRILKYCRFCAKARALSDRLPLPGWGTHTCQKCYYNLDSDQGKGTKEEKDVPVKKHRLPSDQSTRTNFRYKLLI